MVGKFLSWLRYILIRIRRGKFAESLLRCIDKRSAECHIPWLGDAVAKKIYYGPETIKNNEDCWSFRFAVVSPPGWDCVRVLDAVLDIVEFEMGLRKCKRDIDIVPSLSLDGKGESMVKLVWYGEKIK